MEGFLKYLESQELMSLSSGVLDNSTTQMIYFAADPATVALDVRSTDRASQVVVIRSSEVVGELKVSVAEGAKLNLLEILVDGATSRVDITQASDSQIHATVLELSASSADYVVNLNGAGGDAVVNMLQLPTDSERLNIDLRIAHNATDCTSNSICKCAAAKSSTGEFHGLVYVAEGAQRTVSNQSSRNVALSAEAKIVAEPQLEIYADDVKCTHGATVGQMNKEAILYMRQRGLSEDQARKLQLDGFVSDIAESCAIEPLREGLSELVRERLHKM